MVNLIVECEDFDGDKSGNKDAKRHYLKDYWIPAANNLKTYGTWDLLRIFACCTERILLLPSRN